MIGCNLFYTNITIFVILFFGTQTTNGSLRHYSTPTDHQNPVLTGIVGFAGETISVDLQMEAPLGSKWKIQAEIYQFARGRAALLPGKQEMDQILSFEDRTWLNFKFSLSLPDVARDSQLAVRFSALPDDPSAGAGNEAKVMVTLAGLVFAEPNSEAGLYTQIRNWTRSNRIIIDEEIPKLETFFQKIDVPYSTDLQSSGSEEKPTTVLISGYDLPASAKVGTWILFTEDPDALSGIYRKEDPNGNVMIEVTVPLLEDIQHNPLHQKFLFTILQSTAKEP